MYKTELFHLSEDDKVTFVINKSSDRQCTDESNEMILKQRSFSGRMDMFVVRIMVDDVVIGRIFVTPDFENSDNGFEMSEDTDHIASSRLPQIILDAREYFKASPEYNQMIIWRDGVNKRIESFGGWNEYRRKSREAYDKCQEDKKAIVAKYIDWFKENSEKIGSHAFSHNGMPDEITEFIRVNGKTGGSWGVGHLNWIYNTYIR